MNTAEKYNVLLETLAEAIKNKDTAILVKDFEIDDLRAKLERAEKTIAELQAENNGVLCRRKIEK